MMDFDPQHLERALALFEHVEARRWNLTEMPEEELRLLCEFWVCQARALLQDDLAESDAKACQWVLRVVTAVAKTKWIYIYGLSRKHHDDWAGRARDLAARLRRRQVSNSAPQAPSPKTKVVEKAHAPHPSPERLPDLQGKTILIVGGEHDAAVVDGYRDAGFELDWVPGNVRRVQSVVARIRHAHVDGVIFLADLNRHASFFTVRDACRASGTPMVFGTKGASGIARALRNLSVQITAEVPGRRLRHG